jgi:hypothetical protein
MRRSNTETFLAFRRGGKAKDDVVFEVAIDPDIAGDIDTRNSWVEPGDHPTKLQEAHETCLEASAKGVRELMNFIFHDQPFNRRGAMRLVAMKLLAVAQMLQPEALQKQGGRVSPYGRQLPPDQLTLRQVAEMVGTDTRTMRKHQRDFRRAWGFNLYVRPIRRRR